MPGRERRDPWNWPATISPAANQTTSRHRQPDRRPGSTICASRAERASRRVQHVWSTGRASAARGRGAWSCTSDGRLPPRLPATVWAAASAACRVLSEGMRGPLLASNRAHIVPVNKCAAYGIARGYGPAKGRDDRGPAAFVSREVASVGGDKVQERVCTGICRERPPWRSGKRGMTSIRRSRNPGAPGEGVPYRNCVGGVSRAFGKLCLKLRLVTSDKASQLCLYPRTRRFRHANPS